MAKKNKYVGLGIIALAVFLIFRMLALEEKPLITDKITIAAYSGDSSLLIYLAAQENLFKKYGIEVKIKEYEAGALARDGLIKGEADVATMSDSVLVSSSFDWPDLRIMSVISEGKTNKLIARKKEGVEKVSDLSGKKIALTKGTTGEYYLSLFLDTHDLTFKDVELIDLDPSQIVDAFVENRIDFAFSWEPNIYRIKKGSGEDVLVWDAQKYNYFYFLLVARQRWINQNPELARRFIEALIEAERILLRNHQALGDYLRRSFGYSAMYLEDCLADHRYYIYMPQSLLLELENQAIWQIKNNIAAGEDIPNYLDFIYPYALEAIDPMRVSIIR